MAAGWYDAAAGGIPRSWRDAAAALFAALAADGCGGRRRQNSLRCMGCGWFATGPRMLDAAAAAAVAAAAAAAVAQGSYAAAAAVRCGTRIAVASAGPSRQRHTLVNYSVLIVARLCGCV
jgi:hypothetical protein